MLATASELSGTEYHEVVQGWLLAGWFASFMLPLSLLDSASARAECQWIRRWFGADKSW